MQPLQKSHLQVNTDLNALPKVLTWFDQFNCPPINYQTWLKCQLALAEGFTNAVRHAHRGKPSTLSIELEVAMFPERMEIRIWDWGAPFDLEKAIHRMPGKEAEGGRGIPLMCRIADVLSYTRIDNKRNCLLIIKQY
ncbi:MAG TPA: ATP-binding protein [Leptolyngbyaceae cyanobacterium M33_DOE_097]|uniref:ATP-binding protein n=1 Tax=Oscillatoriales cyanobacterium SpSt-418 TaxID=2282169 RepID=A0A7C3KI65_9CYAN|nr:ATP-binding protein [Leptolyngbyaceae cyanobacterium M33_DOE_097]